MASHTKPPIPCYLKEGKAIGAHKNFVRTFNWLVDWISNFRVDGDLEFEQRPDSAHPVVKHEGSDSGGDGEITISGTDGSEHKGDSFEFASDQYSNVSVSVGGNGKLTIGVYYV